MSLQECLSHTTSLRNNIKQIQKKEKPVKVSPFFMPKSAFGYKWLLLADSTERSFTATVWQMAVSR